MSVLKGLGLGLLAIAVLYLLAMFMLMQGCANAGGVVGPSQADTGSVGVQVPAPAPITCMAQADQDCGMKYQGDHTRLMMCLQSEGNACP